MVCGAEVAQVEDTYERPELRKQSLTTGALVVSVSSAAGLPVGGLLTDCSQTVRILLASSHTSVALLQVRRTWVDGSVRGGTGWSGSNPGLCRPYLRARTTDRLHPAPCDRLTGPPHATISSAQVPAGRCGMRQGGRVLW